MKVQPKINITIKRRTSKWQKLATRSVALAHSNQSIWRHFRLVEHKHTGKFIHHRHTSHVVLVGMLLMVGFFLYMSESVALAETSAGSVSVSVIVPGPAPTVGATITMPTDGISVVDQKTIEVSGTCLEESFVTILNNGRLAGSTVCTSAGTFMLQIELQLGKNVLSSFNYDNLNQPGPDTQPVTINATQSSGATEEEVIITPTDSEPILPINPSLIPGLDSNISSCDDYEVGNLPIGGEPKIEVVCVPRLFMPKLEQVLGVLVWGGSPPYAISVDWGNGSGSTLLSLPAQGYKKVTFSYAVAGNYKIAFKLKDADNKEAIVQTAVQVNGESKTPFVAFADDIINKSWFETPVPLYATTIVLTLGFWGGEIFNRSFGSGKPRRRARKVA
jgi:hypothetical protein